MKLLYCRTDSSTPQELIVLLKLISCSYLQFKISTVINHTVIFSDLLCREKDVLQLLADSKSHGVSSVKVCKSKCKYLPVFNTKHELHTKHTTQISENRAEVKVLLLVCCHSLNTDKFSSSLPVPCSTLFFLGLALAMRRSFLSYIHCPLTRLVMIIFVLLA